MLCRIFFQIQCFQSILSREFDITSTECYSVYNKNVAEFNYKLSRGSLVTLIFHSKFNDGAVFRQKFQKVLGLNQKKNASLSTYTPSHADALQLMQMGNGR